MKRLKTILPFITAAIIFCLPFHAKAEEISFDSGSHARGASFFKFRHFEEYGPPVPTVPEYYLYTKDIRLQESHGFFSPGDIVGFRLGYGWNPTDLFNNPKKNLYPLFEPEGIDSVFMSYAFGGHEISTFYSFGKNGEDAYPRIRDGDYQLKMKTHTEILDLAIHYTEAKQNRTDYQGLISGSVLPENATIPVRWQLVSARVSSRIKGIGLHAEGGHAWLSVDDKADESAEKTFAKDHSSFLVGIDYTFENELYLVLEYYQDGQGKTSPDRYTLNDRLGYLSNESDSLGRDNVFLGAKYPFAHKTSIELYNIINANDPSVILNPWLIWSTGDDFTIKFSARFPVGKEDSSVGQSKPSAFAHIQLNF